MKKLIILGLALALGGCASVTERFHKITHHAPAAHVEPAHAAPAPVPPPVIVAAPAPAPAVVPAPVAAPKKVRLLDRIKARFHRKKDK